MVAGFIFKNKRAGFRETSSNLANGDQHNLSLEKCSTDIDLIKSFGNKRTAVRVELLSFPTKGTILDTAFATSITPVCDETITITPAKNNRNSTISQAVYFFVTAGVCTEEWSPCHKFKVRIIYFLMQQKNSINSNHTLKTQN